MQNRGEKMIRGHSRVNENPKAHERSFRVLTSRESRNRNLIFAARDTIKL
jgi:hypothetical protein